MSRTPNIRGRFRGLVAAVRFAFIPILCAVVVAVASEDPRGKALALGIGLAVLGFGIAVHAQEIVAGRAVEPRARTTHRLVSTGEWLASER